MAPVWRDLHATHTGRELFEDLLSRRSLRDTGALSVHFIRFLRWAWLTLPRSSSIARLLDPVMGLMLTLQGVSRTLLENPIDTNANFEMEDELFRLAKAYTNRLENPAPSIPLLPSAPSNLAKHFALSEPRPEGCSKRRRSIIFEPHAPPKTEVSQGTEKKIQPLKSTKPEITQLQYQTPRIGTRFRGSKCCLT